MSENLWIVTYTGRKFSISDPDGRNIDILDIAHGLARIGRWNGQAAHFISVAEHSVHVCNRVPPEVKLQALLHDAPEAYMGDVTRPMKRLIPGIKELHEQLWQQVCVAFGLSPILSKAVLDADEVCCATEAYHLFGQYTCSEGWCSDPNWLVFGKPDTLTEFRTPLEPGRAEQLFLNKYREIMVTYG